MTFDEYAKREGFPLTSTMQPTFRKCWEAAQAQREKPFTYSLAEIRNGTGFTPGVRFIPVEPE